MSTAGPNSPGTAADNAASGSVAWTNPGNITADDANYATCNITSSSTHLLAARNFGFAIPAGSTINGITITHKGKVASGTGNMTSGPTSDATGGSYDGVSNGYTLTTTETTFTIGGASTLFGASWTTSQVNGVNFGCFNQSSGASQTANISINYTTMSITYTVASGYINLPLLGVGLINTLIHGLTLGLCSWRWRPFTRTQTRTAGVMA